MLEILERITNGEGRDGDIEKLEELAYNIKSTALCGLGQTAPNPVLSTLRYFRDEYEAHIYEKRCPRATAKSWPEYRLIPRNARLQSVRQGMSSRRYFGHYKAALRHRPG